MIDLYNWHTSNGRKLFIMLEELGVDYNTHVINIGKDDQFTPEFTAINPNGKIPAMIDQDGPGGAPFSLFESGAMLMYLADKYGKFLPPVEDVRNRYITIQWLMFQMGGLGPMFGQAHHFRRAKTQVEYGIERYTKEARRLWGVLDGHLANNDFMHGDYSIADMAIYPWTARYEWQGVALEEFPNVKRWFETVGARPAVAKAMGINLAEAA
ncbi:MAG: GST-like protein [Paracoccaceae bacterium]|jgi:GST-like protein